MLYVVAIGWIYVAGMMAIVEATSSNGTLLGALVTFVFYGVVPVGIVVYLLATPARRRARRAAERASAAGDPDGGDHAPGAPVAPERKEP
jgi:hypothetical protein